MLSVRSLLAWRPARVISRSYQNFVSSDVLSQIERDCEKVCPVPRTPPQKVCIIGAGSPVGRVTSLMLKQQKTIHVLSLYDDNAATGILGDASDIAHIDTSTAIEAYQGRVHLKQAVFDSDVVLVCGGCHVSPPCCNTPDRDLFFSNMQLVRSATLATAEFAPNAILCIQSPPVDANFALAAYTLRVLRCYNPRRVLGVNSISSMRANQLICSLTGTDPSAGHVPVVGGTSRGTRVPVFSSLKKANIPQSQVECLTKLVRDADDIICKVKNNFEEGHLSIGFATARFVANVMKGLFQSSAFIDSALVQQGDPAKAYGLEMCATPVNVDKGGVSTYVVPELNGAENTLLEDSKCQLLDLLNLGRCAALGEDYCFHNCMYSRPHITFNCPICKKS